MIVESEKELEWLRAGGRSLASILERVVAAAKAGTSTKELDGLAEALILSSGGDPVFKGYRSGKKEKPFPTTLCVSLNDEVVHGLPSTKRILKSGDIISIDFGMRYPAGIGLITDMAVTVGVGKISPEAERLLGVTRDALDIGIRQIKAGTKTGDLGYAIQRHIEENGFGVIRELMGHGVGRKLHEDPNLPNYGFPGEGKILVENMVLALEPMAAAGSPEVRLDKDGWTWRTRDGKLAAHFEHTVVVTKGGAEILTE
ncbi:MAG: type I methionyl aminopeptidase [Candidatus Sungbacteria bacterium]|nr:type I methionyl aminopeptidase [Candidatus Sungbacteria bacterium]